MSFLTTQTEEMLAAEQLLSGINTNLAAQNAGAAAATTVIAPAAADPVSIQQATIFSTYGTTYQTIATEAQTLLEKYAQTLGISSGSYGDTEAINASQAALSSAASPLAAAAATPSNTPLDFLSYLLGSTGNGTNPSMLGGIFGLSSNGANILNIGTGNWASAGSDLLGLAGGGLLDTSAADAAGSAADAAGLADTTAPMAGGGIAGMGAMPMAAAGAGDHGQQPVGAAELGRLGHPGGRHQRRTAGDRGLDRRRAAGRHGRASSRGCREWARPRATAPASAHHATASSRSSCRNRRPSSPRPLPQRRQIPQDKGSRKHKWFLTLQQSPRRSPPRSCTPVRAPRR